MKFIILINNCHNQYFSTQLYPACNAAETLLLHESTIESGLADKILRALRIAGVTIYG